VITVEESKSLTTDLDVVEGMQLDRGYISPYFITDNERMVVEFENLDPAHRQENQHHPGFDSRLGKVARAGQPLLIIAEDVDGEALATLVVNKARGY